MNHIIWEYKVTTIGVGVNVEAELRKHGKNCWELVTVTKSEVDSGIILIFKRPTDLE